MHYLLRVCVEVLVFHFICAIPALNAHARAQVEQQLISLENDAAKAREELNRAKLVRDLNLKLKLKSKPSIQTACASPNFGHQHPNADHHFNPGMTL